MKSPGLGVSSSPVRKLTLLYVTALTSIAAMAVIGKILIQSMLAQQKHIIWICQFCGQCGDLGFDQRAGLEHLTRFLDRRLGDEGAAIWLKAHQAIVSQRLEGRANDSTADRIN